MTTAALPRLETAPARSNPLTRFIANVVGGVIEARQIQARYDHFSRMSNAELAGLGLSREDIPRAAVFGTAKQ